MNIFAVVKTGRRKLWRIIAWLLIGQAAVTFWLWLYVGVLELELPKTAYLKNEKAAWVSKMDIMDDQLDLYEQTLSGIEERDDDVYRALFGLNAIPQEVKMSGIEGVNRYEYLDIQGADSRLKNEIRRVDVLTKRAYIQSMSLDEIDALSKHTGEMVSCMPSVPPVCPDRNFVRLSSRFGIRTDPVYGGRSRHRGVDFAVKRGYPVFATGDGVVEKAHFQYRGYGNEIVVDHGFGYKTRYAHLNTVLVVEGMKVSRGEKIGEVGSSGKSTGAHLHYEVIYKGKTVNPMNYMDFGMPVKEFRAMVDARAQKSKKGKMSTTTELLKRRRKGNE